jgi:RNA-directed DNA polymerase
MASAWERVRANHGAPGIDGITIEQFPDHTRPLWAGIRESLETGSYLPTPVKRAEIRVEPVALESPSSLTG